MTSAEFSQIRKELELTRKEMGERLGDGIDSYSARAVGTWEDGTRKVPPAVSKLMKLMYRPLGR